MDKLQYDSLYKFFISLGITMIALPLAVGAYLVTSAPILISQVEYDALSQYSQQVLVYKEMVTSSLQNIYPWLAPAFILIGIVLICHGIIKWKPIQKNIDKKLDSEATIQELQLMKMTSKEIDDKFKSEIQEDLSADTTATNSSITDIKENQIIKYKEIEEKCYSYLMSKYSKEYTFKQNVQMGKHRYDIIGVSQRDNLDLIVEIKYWKSVVDSRRIYDLFHRITVAGINYETITQRNYQPLVLIVTSKESLPQIERMIELRLQRLDTKILGKVAVKCIAEEIL